MIIRSVGFVIATLCSEEGCATAYRWTLRSTCLTVYAGLRLPTLAWVVITVP